MRKIAVNVNDIYNIEEVKKDIINFLYDTVDEYTLDVIADKIKIDYYICNEKCKVDCINITPEYKGVRLIVSPIKNKQQLFDNLSNGENLRTLVKTKELRNRLFNSYVNSLAIQKELLNTVYNTVITYSPEIKKYKQRNKLNWPLFVEHDLIYTFIKSHGFVRFDYHFYITNVSTFFKIVNLWMFLNRIKDSTCDAWAWWFHQDDVDAGEYLLPLMLNNQNIKIRSIYDF